LNLLKEDKILEKLGSLEKSGIIIKLKKEQNSLINTEKNAIKE